jgi:ribonucleoside-triphosphate reductase
MAKCSMKTEVYSRVCGYHRPVQAWNGGKKEEFKDRKEYEVPAVLPPRRIDIITLPSDNLYTHEDVSIAI